MVGKIAKESSEQDGGGGEGHKLIVNAVHVVLTEFGFVELHSVPDREAFTARLCYTLPQILSDGPNSTPTSPPPAAVIRFQSLGNFVIVYGAVAEEGQPHRLCLDVDRMLCTAPIFAELWRVVKDGLALPLLIDLCEKAGLPPPPCLARIPPELKLKIMGLLPGKDVAKLERVCKEFRDLSRDNDAGLWKHAFEEEFGSSAAAEELRTSSTAWKKRFVAAWEKTFGRRLKKMQPATFIWTPSPPFVAAIPPGRSPSPPVFIHHSHGTWKHFSLR